MNSFGLGLVLSFVDNASAGMNTATSNFNRMSATADSLTSSVSASATEMASIAYSLSAVGDTFTNIGESIIGVFASVSQSVIDTGTEMQGYRMQLTALYGSVEAGEAKMEEVKRYAMSSVFEIQSLIPAVTMMKSVGIEALDEITTSSGNATQKLLDYASDLAAMMPYMRNVYGTGVNAAMGAFKEYIAEGNSLSLKRGAGLDITSILGESKGSTVEERTQQIADLIEKLNIVGYTAQLAGTPMQRMSNMQDAMFNSLSKIADSGVFEVYCGLLETLSNWVFSLVENEETFNVITGVVADTITALLSPLQSMLDWVVENTDAIIEWIKANPELTKNILLTVAAVGAFLVVGGSLLKLLSSIAFASAGLSVLKTLPALLGKLLISALPLIGVAGLIYTAWEQNIGGLKDVVTNVLKNFGDIVSILGDAFSDNTLSEEKYQKALELGILPFINGILQLKYYWDFFVEGFKEGFKSVFEGFFNILRNMGIDVDSLAEKFTDFLSKLTQPGAEEQWTKIGEVIGTVVASLALLSVAIKVISPVINAILGIGKAVLFVGKILKPFVNLFGSVFKFAGKEVGAFITVLKGGQGVTFFSKVAEGMRAVISGGMKLKDAMSIIFGPVATAVAGVVSVVTGAFMAVLGFVKQLTDGFSWFWEIIKWVGIALAVVGAILLGAAAWPAVLIGAIVGVVTTLIVIIKDNWKAICEFFKTVGTWIYDNVIKPVADFFVNLWNGIVFGVTTAFNAVKNFLATIANWIYTNLIQPVVNFFVNIIFPIISKIAEIVAKIVEIVVTLVVVAIQQIIKVFKNIVNWIYNNVIKPVVNFFTNLWNKIVSLTKAFIKSVKNVINTIVSWIDVNIITPISDFFTGLWESITTAVSNFIEGVKEIFLTIVSWIDENIIQPIADFFTGLWEDIQYAFEVVADTISGVLTGAINAVLSFVCGLINGVITAINWAIDIINMIPGVSIEKIELLEVPQLAEGGVVDKATTAVIGEAGTEAIVPLKNNTEWVSGVASLVVPALLRELGNTNSGKETVVASTNNNTNSYDNSYYNSIYEEKKNTTVEENNIDNSVTFSSGSIIIQVANTTDTDLEKVANKLMKIIARKQQLRAMAVR